MASASHAPKHLPKRPSRARASPGSPSIRPTPRLFAANDAGAGSIDVFNSSFNMVSLGANAFTTPTAISAAGLVPFDVTDLGGNVFVTYAPSGHVRADDGHGGPGRRGGIQRERRTREMSTSTPTAISLRRGASRSPRELRQVRWRPSGRQFRFVPGVTDVINAFNPMTDALVGSIDVNPGAGNTAGGLWSLVFGGSGSDGNPNTLFFTDGINGETDGLFGSITAARGRGRSAPSRNLPPGP